MTKTVLAALAVLMIPATVLAQTDPLAPPPPAAPTAATTGSAAQLLGADFLISLPVSDYGDVAGFGIGALLRYEYNLMPKLNLTGRAGLIYHLPKNDVTFMQIPVLVGVKYDITPEIYAGAELGIFYLRASGDGPGGISVSSSDTNLGLALGGGYRLGIIDVLLQFHFLDLGNFGDAITINAGIGYNFWNG